MTTETISTNSTARAPELVGQIVVVIGGSAGIGLETARRVRAEGADVVLAARNPERLEQAALELGAQSSAAFDANDPASLERFFEDLPTPIDHVMVTGPGPHYKPPLEMDTEEARAALGEHMVLALAVARNARGRVRPAGSLVFIGGTSGRRIRPGLEIVSAVTAGMPALTASLALELAPIRVNLIAPGFVDRVATRLGAHEAALATEVINRNASAHFVGGIPIGESSETGAVDPYLRMFGQPGLHVMDGSVMPANPGVNPSLSITALVERAISLWPNKGDEDTRPPLGSGYERTEPVRPHRAFVPAGAPGELRLDATKEEVIPAYPYRAGRTKEKTMTPELAADSLRTVGRGDAIPNDFVVPYYLDGLKRRISVARVADRLYAFDDLCICADRSCPLSGGLLAGTTLMCQCHGSRFDIITGAVINGPATEALHVYEVQEVDGDVQIRV